MQARVLALLVAFAAVLAASAVPVRKPIEQPHADCSYDSQNCCSTMNSFCEPQLSAQCSEGALEGFIYTDADSNGCGCSYIEL